MDRITWDNYFMKIAEVTALRSPDNKKVGAVVVDSDNRIIGTGYNGLPKGMNDDIDWNEREFIRKVVIHAETNALLHLQKRTAVALYCTLTPCPQCIKLIKACGIQKVYFKEIYREYDETKKLCDFFKINLTHLK